MGIFTECPKCEEKNAEIERLRKALQSSCDEQRQLFRDEANFPCEAAIENEVLRGLLKDAIRWHEQFPVQRVREEIS